MVGKSGLRRSSGGPCSHCYVTVTPCWRKGPPEKPILCNACGARYLVKRTLDGYMPGQRNGVAARNKRANNREIKNEQYTHPIESRHSKVLEISGRHRSFRSYHRQQTSMEQGCLENKARMAACTLALLRCAALSTSSNASSSSSKSFQY